MILVWFVAGWCVGLWASDMWPLWAWCWGSLWLGFSCRAAGGEAWQRTLLIVCLGFAGGAARMLISQQPLPANHISHAVDQKITFAATIIEEPRWTAEKQRIVVEAQQLHHSSATIAVNGRVQVELPPEPAYTLGTLLVFSGDLRAPRSGQGFDYAAYLARRSIYVQLNKAVVEHSQPPAPSLRGTLLSLKQRAKQLIEHTIPEPQAALLVGILLGIQSSVPPDVWSAFNRTGTSHILVISGWNISIIVVALLACGKSLGLRQTQATGLALATIVLYVLLVGPSAAVVRAAIMGAIVACAVPLGRRSDAWSALAAACWIMTLLNPHTLWDLGFQLSSLATASLFAWGTPIQHKLAQHITQPWLRWIIEPLAATLAAQIWALPPILYHFGNLSLIAPLANIVIGPAVPLAMAAGAMLVVLGLALRPLALIALPLTWFALWWIIVSIDMLAAVPWAAVQLPIFSVWWVCAYYLLCAAFWWWHHTRQKEHKFGTIETSSSWTFEGS